MKFVLLAVLLTPTLLGAGEIMKDPESVVVAFMEDYKSWNDKAHSEAERLDHSEEAMEKAEAEYEKVLVKYCRPGFRGEPIAFGSESSHDPLTEKILAVVVDGNKAIVKTKHIYTRASLKMEADYEYHLSLDEGRWYLEQVYYVDADGKYEGL